MLIGLLFCLIALVFSQRGLAQRGSGLPVETGVTATYQGRQIDLAQGWQGAQTCVAYTAGDVRCYRNTADFARDFVRSGGTGAKESELLQIADCPKGYFCAWTNINYSGKRLVLKPSGSVKLGKYGWRDRISSTANYSRNDGVVVWDYRTGLPDPHFFHVLGSFNDYRKIPYVPFGGGWNDRADQIDF